jgi:hypothetical protein
MKLKFALPISLISLNAAQAFVVPTQSGIKGNTELLSSSKDVEVNINNNQRRATVALLIGGIASLPIASVAEETQFLQEYADFAMTDEGWSFRDVKGGEGQSPKVGDRVVFDWSGYTIGYFGRPFEAKGYVHTGLWICDSTTAPIPTN